jgi:regulator of sigma E protease
MTIAGFPIETILSLPITLIAFLILLSIIVFFHEYGHFSVARMLGVRVDVFSIGFGKTLARWRDRKGTEWRIAMLPLGGYVKFFGDAGPASNASDAVNAERDGADHPATTQFPRPGQEHEIGRGMSAEERAVCYHFKPVWARALIVAAGPFANFILAIVIFAGLLMTLGQVVGDPKVGAVQPDSAAAEAGFEKGDVILTANGQKVGTFSDLTMIVRLSSGESVTFEVDRGGDMVVLTATPRRQVIKDAFGNDAEAGVLGVAGDQAAFHSVRYGPGEAFSAAVKQVWQILHSTGKFLWRLIAGKEDAKQLGGPIKMAQFAGQSALSGFSDDASLGSLDFLTRLKISVATFINLAGVVSVSIGFLNLLPVPVLDGGHLMYYAYEAAAGRPLGVRAQAIGFRVGIVLLASFMLFVTWNDISSYFAVKS